MFTILFASFWFYPLLIMTFIITFASFNSEDDIKQFVGPFFSIAIFMTSLYFIYDVNFFDLLSLTIFDVLKYLGYYILIGAFWSIVKWNLFVKREIKEFKGYITKYKNKKFSGTFEEYLVEMPITSVENFNNKLLPTNNKSKISIWFVYWPISFINFMFKDFAKIMFNKIFKFLNLFYQKILNRQMEDLNKLIKKENEEHNNG